jgi:hypothetical protein
LHKQPYAQMFCADGIKWVKSWKVLGA